MKNLEEELKKYSEIYKLNFNSFKIIKKKTLFREKKLFYTELTNIILRLQKKQMSVIIIFPILTFQKNQIQKIGLVAFRVLIFKNLDF